MGSGTLYGLVQFIRCNHGPDNIIRIVIGRGLTLANFVPERHMTRFPDIRNGDTRLMLHNGIPACGAHLACKEIQGQRVCPRNDKLGRDRTVSEIIQH